MNVEQIYKDAEALLEGHFKLSSGNHSQFYLQSAKVLKSVALVSFKLKSGAIVPRGNMLEGV